MRTKAIFTACLVLVWLAFQTTTVLAHYAPGDAADYAHAHGGGAVAALDAADDFASGHGAHGNAAGGGQTTGEATHPFVCCSLACVAFIVIDMELSDCAVPADSYAERRMTQPNPVASSLGTPPPNLHL